MTEAKGVEAVERALSILECFDVGAQELSLAELSRKTGFYKSTILRLCVSLERFGYLLRDGESGRFRLGPAVGRLGACYGQRWDLAALLRPELAQLCEASCETASFYLREGDRRVCLYRAEPARAIRHAIEEGDSMPLALGASGKILRAFGGDDPSPAVDTLNHGHAISLGERDAEVAAVAVPIITRSGRLLGALALSGLITRFNASKQAECIQLLNASRARIEAQLHE